MHSPPPGIRLSMDLARELSEEADSGRAAWLLLFKLFRSNRRHFQELAAAAGLAPVQLHLLLSLDPDKAGPMSELAEALGCDASYVTSLADRMEAKGLTERLPSPSDRRVKLIALTPAGAGLREELVNRVREPPAFIAALDEGDRNALRDILVRACQATGEDALA